MKNPPDGVEYLWNEPGSATSRSLAKRALRLLRLPHVQTFTPPRDACDLIHAAQGLLVTAHPWVVDIEHSLPFVGTSFDRWRNPIARTIIRRILRRSACKAILPWTETAAAGFLVECGDDAAIRSRVRVVHPACALGPAPKPRSGPPSRLIFVANRPDHNFVYKGGRELLAGFHAVRQRHPNLTLAVVGARPANLGSIADLPGVEWHGMVDRAALASLYANADLYVMPSFSDTFGMVFIEAMGHGLPVLALNRPYTRDIVRHGETGWLVSPSASSIAWSRDDGRFAMNTEDFGARILASPPDEHVTRGVADALERLIGDPALTARLAAQAREEVAIGRFSIGRRNTALREIYTEALEARP